MEKKLILKSDILSAIEKVGVKPGQVIMVHTSLGSISDNDRSIDRSCRQRGNHYDAHTIVEEP